jgi:hypothetical protein
VTPWRIVDLGTAPYRDVAKQLALVEQRQTGKFLTRSS